MLTALLGCLLVTLTFRYLFLRSRARSSLRLPPGPKRLPILGNLLNVPSQFEWKTYERWGEEFGSDILYLNVVGTPLIVLNSFEAANCLLDQRSAIYSSRMGWSWLMVFTPYGDVWKERRRLFQQYLHPNNTSLHEPAERLYTHIFLRNLLDKPDRFIDHIRHVVGEITLAIGYGIKTRSENEPLIAIAEAAVSSVTDAGIPGRFLVDTFPMLRFVPEWFPGAGFQRQAREWRAGMLKFLTIPFQSALKEISFVSVSVGDSLPSSLSKQDLIRIQHGAGQIFIGGSDTSVSSLSTFVLAMTCFPETQKKAQKELDLVLKGRLPEHSDLHELTYLQALVKEVLRWQPVTPLGIPHLVTEEDEYAGYRIPAGSTVISNIWAISRNEEVYPDAHLFKPERFLSEGVLRPDVRDPLEFVFGFGRRICPGKHIAISTITMIVASMLSTLTIEKAIDEAGHPIEPTLEYNTLLVTHPLPFKCLIKPRSKEAVNLIRTRE
ncbi:cytochrome P450 [Crucibulum laeve]|uniref:Cytochrome P450 n=1 Tax=Crucibulum laeve TaxID=68775 RepID=A0A5C3M8Z4_9AGAR|nr:cytochrome P450 [Crucibulum laeve]